MNGYRPMLFQKLTEGAEIRNSTDWNIYVKKVPFKPIGDLKTPYVQNYKDIMKGGVLELEMGPEPNTNWGVNN